MVEGIKTYSLEALSKLFGDARIPSFRTMQIASWLYNKGVTSYSEMSNIPKVLREQLELSYPLCTPELVDEQTSKDGTTKFLLKFQDGALVETVGLPSPDGRLSVCCSSQAGCAMACSFCATGKGGLTRSLAPGEIIDQINVVRRCYGTSPTNIVVMGQGEPFANYDNVLAALRIANHPKLLGIGARHITVSSCGIIKGINRFATEPEQFTLAVSLHSAIPETRNQLMPAVKGYPLGDLRKALIDYSSKTGRRFSFEYALMKDVNDSNNHLQELIKYCRGLLCHVNLIPLNEIEESPFKPASKKQITKWCDSLNNAGIPSTIRASRGADISGACGQLANKQLLQK